MKVFAKKTVLIFKIVSIFNGTWQVKVENFLSVSMYSPTASSQRM